MSREVIHLEPPKVPLLGKPEEVRAGHETEDKDREKNNDREKKEKEEAFEALYNNRKDVKGGLGEEKGGVRENKGGKVWKKWVVGGVVGVVVVGGVMMGEKIREQGTESRVQGTGYRVQGTENREQGTTDMNSWYAVHLADGKVYYGRLNKVETEYPELTEVFYEQAQTNADMSAGRQEITHPRLSGDPSPSSADASADRQEGNATTTEGMVKEVPNAGKVGAGKGGLGGEKGGRIVLVKLGTEVSRPEDRLVINKQNLLFYEKLAQDSPIVQAIENYLKSL